MPANANAGTPRNQVIHGARAFITVDGKTVGYVQNVSGSINRTLQPVDVLDNLAAEELLVTSVAYSLSAAMVKIVGRSLVDAGIFDPLDRVLFGRGLTVEFKDRPTDTATYTWEGCQAQSVNFSIQKGTLTAEQVSFSALRVRDEKGRLL